jgi:hypothetical protein
MKRFKLVEGEEAKEFQMRFNSNRIRTYFRRKVTSESLQCPLNNKRTEVGAGFK